MDIPTDLPRTRDPPEHDTQRPAATTPTAEPLQTPDEEAREILAKAIRNQAEDGPSTRRAAIRAYKSCMPWSVNTAHSSRRYMRPLKNTPHAARAPRKTSNTGLNRKNSLLSHRNSRLSCYTACPPCLTPGPYQKWDDFFLRMSTFSVQETRTPPHKHQKYRAPLKQ